MRGLLIALVVGWAVPAHADASRSISAVCQRAAQTVAKLISASDKAQTLLGRRCEKDKWSRDAQACFASAGTSGDARRCLDKLGKDQRTQLEGDADRLNETKLTLWLSRRVQVARALPPPTITLAVLETPPDLDKSRGSKAEASPRSGDAELLTRDASLAEKSRALRSQGMSAYQAGRYDAAVRKFAAAMDVSPSPELIYYAAQAYRMKGERVKAIDLYEQYLDVAPHGPAANACRAELEKLRDIPQ